MKDSLYAHVFNARVNDFSSDITYMWYGNCACGIPYTKCRCGKVFYTDSELSRHINVVHLGGVA